MKDLTGITINEEFRLLALEATGGWSYVYRAQDIRSGMPICIKILKEEFITNEYAVNRFKEEAQARFDHKNIVKILRYGHFEEHHYIAMEWIDGQTIAHYLERGSRFTTIRALRVAQDVTMALEHVWNQRKVVHRDIKPSNVFICTDGSAKVADFGISKALLSEASVSTVVGSLAYMSPEQTRGQAVDFRADFYSLGLMLFEMVTLKRPFGDCTSFEMLRDAQLDSSRLKFPAAEETYLLDFMALVHRLTSSAYEHRYSSHAALLGTIVQLIGSLEQTGSNVVWFMERNRATGDMLATWKQYSHLSFVGISHRELAGYIENTLALQSSPLPWSSVVIMFAEPKLGRVWEGSDFGRNMRANRHEILFALTDPRWVQIIPSLTQVELRQCNMPVGLTGGCFEVERPKHGVAYVVLTIPLASHDAKDALTLKVLYRDSLQTHPEQRTVFHTIVESHKQIRRCASRSLGTFTRSVWDASCQEWDQYCTSSNAYKSSTECFAEFARLHNDDRILDVGCGVGNLELILLSRNKYGRSITALEASPQMLRMAKNKLKDFPAEGMRYALCHISKSQEESSQIDINDENGNPSQFSVIMLHLMLPALVPDPQQLTDLAIWCQRHLKKGGRVVMSARNSTVDTPREKEWLDWQDPLRPRLRELLRREKMDLLIRPAPAIFTREEICSCFGRNGFTLRREQQKTWTLSVAERLSMWTCPAILDSFVNVFQIGIKAGKQIVQEAFSSFENSGTMPMTVRYFEFRKRE